MFIFKRNPSSSGYNLAELKSIIGRTVELTLETDEDGVYFLKEHNLIMIFSWEFNYMEYTIYNYTDFEIVKSGSSRLRNQALYMEQRDLKRKDNTIKYIEDKKIKDLSERNLRAFYCLSELINIFDVEIHAANLYKCVW